MIKSAEDLYELIDDLRHHGGDTTECEVKRGRGGIPSLGETLSAFGNMPDGGTIIIGLDEAGGFGPTGIEDLAAIKSGIAQQAREGVDPPVTVEFSDFRVDGVDVIVCDVAGLPLVNRPCFYQGRAYLRFADGDYLMSDVEIQMIKDRQRQAVLETTMWIRDDVRPVPDSGIDDLNDQHVDTLLRNARSLSPFHRDKADEVLLRNLGVVTKPGLLTVAGAYVLAEYPQRFVPSWSATAAVQLTEGGSARTRDLEHFAGAVREVVEGTREWVSRNMHTTIGYRTDGNAVDEAELPAVTVRELIGNALVHRDLSPLSHGKRVEIRMTGDQLTMWSPGGLRGITTRQLGHRGGKHAVNETVYELCKKLTLPDGGRLIEGEGGGIREARERMRSAGLKPLRFHDTGVSFVALVSRRRLLSDEDSVWLAHAAAGHRLTQEQRIILASMHHGQEWTNRMIRTEFDQIDSRDATSLLQDLVSRGLATAAGERGGARYRLSDGLELSRKDVLDVAVPPRRDAVHASSPMADTRRTQNAAMIRKALGEGDGRLTVGELVEAAGLTDRQTRYTLHEMRNRGEVDTDGLRPAHWWLT